jgi:hypothetical protein
LFTRREGAQAVLFAAICVERVAELALHFGQGVASPPQDAQPLSLAATADPGMPITGSATRSASRS